MAPALTNKLNYLLWIQDLAELNHFKGQIQGIDVGTGAAIYFAAIAAKFFRWKILATESNEQDFKMATENVQDNNLSEFVHLVKTDQFQLFKLEDDFPNFFFTLCNPPFYQVDEEIREREEYNGVCSGRSHEIAGKYCLI